VLTSAIDSSMDASTATALLSEAREKLFSVHRDKMAYLSEAERKHLHRAKNLSRIAENLVVAYRHANSELSEIPDDTRKKISSIRAEMSELQHLLRDSRSDRLLGLAIAVETRPTK